MELKLQKLVDNLITVARVQEYDANNSIVVRLSNSLLAKINVIVCSVNEPTNLILPLNVTWINLDTNSNLYKQPLVRLNKNASVNYDHTWSVATKYSDVMCDQAYDATDALYIGSSANIGFASTTKQGIVKLSCAPVDANNPIAVGINDARLTDARTPLPHIHPLRPAEALMAGGGGMIVHITGAPQDGAVLRITDTGPDCKASWVVLKQSDLVAG